MFPLQSWEDGTFEVQIPTPPPTPTVCQPLLPVINLQPPIG